MVKFRNAAGPPDEQSVAIFTADGRAVGSYSTADEGMWIDTGRFVLYQFVWRQEGPGGPWAVVQPPFGDPWNGVANLLELGSDSPVRVDLEPGSLADGHGSVAVRRFEGECSESACPAAHYRIWTDVGTTEELPGYPVAWSPTGEYLGILRPISEGPGVDGWPHVIRMPEVAVTHENLDVVVSTVAFDPSGRYASYDVGGPVGTVIVDLASGEAQELGPNGPRGLWATSERMIVLSTTGNAALVELDGTVVSEWANVGNLVAGSQDGSTFLFTWDQDQKATVIRNTAELSLDLPTAGCAELLLSPDGRGLLAVCPQPDQGMTALLRRL